MADDLSIIKGTNAKPVASDALIDFFSQQNDISGELFIGYPIISKQDGRYPLDALLVSKELGFLIFDLIEGSEIGDAESRQDDAVRLLQARLLTYKELTSSRQLQVPIEAVSFAPACDKLPSDIPNLANQDSILELLSQFTWRDSNEDLYRRSLSAIQNISTIRQSKGRRIVNKEESRGAKLKRLEGSIATLDKLQGKAVIETVPGVQRIRGLAGSGKTIVLALKAAYLHAQHPDWRIAVTFNTRSLKGQFVNLINTFCIEQTREEPDWDRIRVINAWGAPGASSRTGIYYEFTQAHQLDYLDFRTAKSRFGNNNIFEGVCEKALSEFREDKALYDVILVDEAQDFPASFLRLCYSLLSRDKRLVYAYDELQNLSGGSLPGPEEIFGLDDRGYPNVVFEEPRPDAPRQDVILERCYRNSRPVLVTAHSLGFGIYREPTKNAATKLVQMFNYPQLWNDIGYEVVDGALELGRDVRLKRSKEASPEFLEHHSDLEDLIQFSRFDSEEEQARWVVAEILKNLREDELRPDDVVVINPDPVSTREKVGRIRSLLFEAGINSHLAGVDTDPDVFFLTDKDSVTFTGIFRAKGNEAGMVYVINAQDCHSSAWNLATIRNRLFSAITRSKAWVRVVGIGEDMKYLASEFGELKKQAFQLHFKYPSQDELDRMKVVHRDLTGVERKRLESRRKGLSNIVKDLEAGKISLEDLDDELLEKLRAVLVDRDS